MLVEHGADLNVSVRGIPINIIALARYWPNDLNCTGPLKAARTGPISFCYMDKWGARSGPNKTVQKCLLCLMNSQWKTIIKPVEGWYMKAPCMGRVLHGHFVWAKTGPRIKIWPWSSQDWPSKGRLVIWNLY